MQVAGTARGTHLAYPINMLPAAPTSDARSTRRMVMLFAALVLLDQVVKAGALALLPAATLVARYGEFSLDLGWHFHLASPLFSFVAFAVAAVWCLLPVSRFVKVMMVAASVSNHVENVVRPGTVDFIVINLGGSCWVANIADLYIVIGVAAVAVELSKRISSAKSWKEPVDQPA
jgi:lipoprotein signal peptidase